MNRTNLSLLALVVLFPFVVPASRLKDTPKSKPSSKLEAVSPQQRSLDMLDAARSMLAGAPAGLRAHACYHAAAASALVEPAKEVKQLKQCFRETTLLDDKDQSLKADLQLRILDAIYSRDPQAVDDLLPSADAQARIDIQSRILQRLVDSKNYDEALALVSRLSYSPDFPYRAAAELMVHLPADRDIDRRTVFLTALESYRQQDPSTAPSIEDMATLVIRFWRHLDPKLTLQAIDEIFKHAQEDLNNKFAPTLTIGTALGEAQFSSAYQYRLFELMPIFQQLDPGRAESILNDNPKLAAVLKTYPQGLASLEPTFRDTPLKPGESPKFTITHRLNGGTSPQANADLLHDQLARESVDISSEASNDPRAAIQKAAQLPDTGVEDGRSPRADALARIAIGQLRQHPDIAGEALEQMLKAAADYPPLAQSFYFLTAANIKFLMNDKPEATRLVVKAFSVASRLYRRDTKNDDANRAFKFDWPSTAVWRACIVLEDKIDPALATGMLTQINDPEIRASVQITLANLRLGGPLPANTVRQQFGDGPGSVQDFGLMR
ncbi:MAG TPA: hypothetical protein VFP59_19140 [Candidatus Angelobacter sp.]|nr:hypothetical protein [Candidatus Angelobacter sp.]